MKKFLFFITATIGFFSCTNDGTSLFQFFNTDNLPSQFYTINLSKDTVLHTQQGASIFISKGDIISKDKSTTLTLEIKEAYSLADILKAGLITKSNGNMLSSGGMIYINAKDKNASIVNPIKISMPSDNVAQQMQLFKGKEQKDGAIDWSDPQPLLGNTAMDTINHGKLLFINNCASCHTIGKDVTGPSLAFLPQRRDKEWLSGFIHNSSKMIANGDRLANCLYEEWNKTAMTSFPNMSDEDLSNLYAYINYESKYLNPADYPDFKASLDSCDIYNKIKDELIAKRQKYIEDNGKEAERIILDKGCHIFSGPKNLVVPKAEYATYYQFNITTFGWYNVDAFTANIPGFVNSILKAKINGNLESEYNIYLIIPAGKVCVDGGLLKNENSTYGFFTDDGNVPLPQGKTAYIVAFTERDQMISFGFTQFTTNKDNHVTVNTNLISKDSANKIIAGIKLDNLSMQVSDTKNADSIRSTDIDLQNVEKLKPKGADCNCMPQSELIDSVKTL